MSDGPFTVTFYFKGQSVNVMTPDHEPWSMDDIKKGFWVSEERQLCRESQGRFWVPPSMIMLIERLG